MKRIMILGSLVLIAACHPLFMFKPPKIKDPIAQGRETQKIHVAVDSYGIPFIKAKSFNSAMYGLGFVHARDRLFQLDLVRHAALGRMTELFGEKVLELDRKLRLLTFKLEEQLAGLAPEERELVNAYVRGVNDGAQQRGRSAEHFLLGIDFEEFSALHVLAIARLQSWQLASDLVPELARLRIAQSSLSDAAKAELFSVVDDQNSAIIAGKYSSKKPVLTLPKFPLEKTEYKTEAESNSFIQLEDGASNAWVVEGRLTKSKHAILMNDPHLRHAWPSNFYLATLESEDMHVSGASFVGLPAILIGSSKMVSWGVTASYANTQDTVLLKRDPKNPQVYFVDDKPYILEKLPLRFCYNKKGNCKEEEHYISIFGPVMDSRYDPFIGKNDAIAVMWTGFLTEEHVKIVTPFVELIKAKNVFESEKIIQRMTLPGVNMVFADIEGNIGYSYAGLMPKRDLKQHPFLPLDGGVSSSKWSGFYEKPKKSNPQSGYIVTANQNIFSQNESGLEYFGQQGAPPFRALRIKQVVDTYRKENTPLSFDKLAEIQLDNVSLEAQELAPLLGRICHEEFKEASSSRQEFAQELMSFDGSFTTESRAALPYEIMTKHLIEAKLALMLGAQFLERSINIGQLNYALKHGLLQSLKGEKNALFNDKNVHAFVKAQCEPAFLKLVKVAGNSPWQWRWGRHHHLERQSPLAQAPFIGGLFRDRKREVDGSASSPLAETGTPVIYGANLRAQVLMTNPPQLKMVLDSGNSGVVGDQNSLDQADLWHKGHVIDMATEWTRALKEAKTSFSLIDYSSSSSSSRNSERYSSSN